MPVTTGQGDHRRLVPGDPLDHEPTSSLASCRGLPWRSRNAAAPREASQSIIEDTLRGEPMSSGPQRVGHPAGAPAGQLDGPSRRGRASSADRGRPDRSAVTMAQRSARLTPVGWADRIVIANRLSRKCVAHGSSERPRTVEGRHCRTGVIDRPRPAEDGASTAGPMARRGRASGPAREDGRLHADGGDRLMALKEEVLGQFLGDETFPIEWTSETERLLFWVYDDLHCPKPLSPMYEDIGGWWLSCDHMFRRFGTPFATRLDLQEHQRLPVHGGHPGRGRARRRDAGVRPTARTPSSPADDDYAGRIGAYLGVVLPVYGHNFTLVAHPLRARDAAQLRLHRGHARPQGRAEPGRPGGPPRGRHRHARPPLEDPLDAELRAAQRHAQPAGRHGEDARQGATRSCWAASRTRPTTATGTRSGRSGR